MKGIDVLIRACAKLNENFRLLLVGSGPQEKELRNIVRDAGIEKRVVFTGFRRDIPDILAASDIFVVSSYSEGLPTSLLEAMAAGTACIVTDIGLPVIDGETGIVVPSGDENALSGAIRRLIKDKKLRKKLGENAAKFVKYNCTREKAAESHMRVFREVLG